MSTSDSAPLCEDTETIESTAPELPPENLKFLEFGKDFILEPEWVKDMTLGKLVLQNHLRYHLCDESGERLLQSELELNVEACCGGGLKVASMSTYSLVLSKHTAPHIVPLRVKVTATRPPFNTAQLMDQHGSIIAEFKLKWLKNKIEASDAEGNVLFCAKVPGAFTCTEPVEYMVYKDKTNEVLGSYVMEPQTCRSFMSGTSEAETITTTVPGSMSWKEKAAWLVLILVFKHTMCGVDTCKIPEDS